MSEFIAVRVCFICVNDCHAFNMRMGNLIVLGSLLMPIALWSVVAEALRCAFVGRVDKASKNATVNLFNPYLNVES